tara:strand:- start:10099 stop:10632 length:534 start_codon:yes stop_codon:yes gene_type:complete
MEECRISKSKLKKIVVNDKMQQDYTYILQEPIGENFDIDFKPELTPKEMLALGVFGGKYMTDCINEFPSDWFLNAKLSPTKKNIKLNFYKVDASLPLHHWQQKGWIFNEDPRGWFQWYCRYFMGRRLPDEDDRQIKRWKAMKRHVGAVIKGCKSKDLNCRVKQRQALLHWSYDSRNI